MKNKFVILLFFTSFAVFADDSPLTGWEFNEYSVTLNGRRFWKSEYAESWREQDGFAMVGGRKIHYWLYDTVSYHNGKADEIYNEFLPHWIEKTGYVIDYDHIENMIIILIWLRLSRL